MFSYTIRFQGYKRNGNTKVGFIRPISREGLDVGNRLECDGIGDMESREDLTKNGFDSGLDLLEIMMMIIMQGYDHSLLLHH